MNPRHVLPGLLLLPSLAAGGISEPYKETMSEQVRSKQPVVYARVTDHGFGVQYWRAGPGGAGIGGSLGSVAGGWAGFLVGSAVDVAANAGATDLSEQDAERLAPLFDRAAAQLDLQRALTETLTGLPLFASPVTLKALAPGAPTHAAAFNEDPVLVVELYASLIVDYRGLQVTAIAYELSPAALAADPRSPVAGRVYRNRFDYVSDLLPAPAIKTKEQIEADVEAVEAKYRGRKLTKTEQAQKTQERRDAAAGTTLEKWREPLMEQWLANDGAKLHEALRLGTASVIQLLGRDLLDFKSVDVRKVDPIGWKILQDVTVGRYTSLFIGGPFAGALISEPSGLSVAYCYGTAFSATLAKNSPPKLCPRETDNRPKRKRRR